jgi:hypothetical protein
MSEQPNLPPPDLRADSQKFEDALYTLLTTPNEDVRKHIDAEREQRRQQAQTKQR